MCCMPQGRLMLGSQTVLSNGSILQVSTIDDDFDGDALSDPFDADDDGDDPFRMQTTIVLRAVCLIL